MMPDLGKYAAEVISAYGIAILLLISLVALSIRASAQAKRALDAQEEKARKHGR